MVDCKYSTVITLSLPFSSSFAIEVEILREKVVWGESWI